MSTNSIARLRTWLGKMALATGALLLTLIVLEVCLRLFAPQPLDLYNFALLNEEGMVEKGNGLWSGTLYRIDTKPPGEGPMRANKRLQKGGVVFEINDHGWRDRSYPQKAAPGTYRLTVIGDSVTLGYGVELAETYHKRLEDHLNQAGRDVGKHFEVIALAGAGGTTYDALRTVRHHIGYFQPQELWLAFNLNDILFQPYELWRKKGEVPLQTTPTETLPPLRVRAALLLGWVREKSDALLRPRSHLYHLLRQRSKALLRHAGVYSPTMQPEAAFAFSSAQAAWSATLAAILEMREEAVRHGARFTVVVLPTDPQTSPEVAKLYRDQFHFRFDDDFEKGVVQQRICQDLAVQGIECVDPLPLFRTHPQQQLFLRVYGDSIDWNHPNAAGHALLADALFAAVRPRLLPDQKATEKRQAAASR